MIKLSYTKDELLFEEMFIFFVINYILCNNNDKKNISIANILNSNNSFIRKHHINILNYINLKHIILDSIENYYLEKIMDSAKLYVNECNEAKDIQELSIDLSSFN